MAYNNVAIARRHARRLMLVATLFGCTLFPGIELPANASMEPSQSLSQWHKAVTHDSLRATYQLDVVALPNAPSEPALPAPRGATAKPSDVVQGMPQESASTKPHTLCPIEVRGVVLAEDKASSFAIVRTKHDNALVRKGQRLPTAHGTVAVASIAKNHIVLQGEDTTYRCSLSR